MGALGPRRVKLDQLSPNPGPPYALVDNEASWLPETDFVFIDPVSTGYSRPVPGEKAGDFHSVKEDVKSVGRIHPPLHHAERPLALAEIHRRGKLWRDARGRGLCSYLQDEVNLYRQWRDHRLRPAHLGECRFQPRATISPTRWLCRPWPAPPGITRRTRPSTSSGRRRTCGRRPRNSHRRITCWRLARGDQLPEAERQAVAAHISRLIGLPGGFHLAPPPAGEHRAVPPGIAQGRRPRAGPFRQPLQRARVRSGRGNRRPQLCRHPRAPLPPPSIPTCARS